jgi:hypothetical protein
MVLIYILNDVWEMGNSFDAPITAIQTRSKTSAQGILAIKKAGQDILAAGTFLRFCPAIC